MSSRSCARMCGRWSTTGRKRARRSKVRPVENGDVKGAELRAGLIKNVEQTSNASVAYDSAAETLIPCGFGAWLVRTDYNSDDSWDQDFKIEPIEDPLNSVWLDPDNMDDPDFGFIERTYTRAGFAKSSRRLGRLASSRALVRRLTVGSVKTKFE